MVLMEKNTRKRQRFESQAYCSIPSTGLESEENPGKRICEDANCGNVDSFSEIMSCEVDCPQESINEDLVCDMMKKLEEEIGSRSSHEAASANKCGSNQICDILRENEDEAESVFREELGKVECEDNASLDDVNDILCVSDSDMGIPCSPQMDFSQVVSDYFEDYGFIECLEMERDVELQVLLQKWWGDNDREGCETRDLISVQDCSLFSI